MRLADKCGVTTAQSTMDTARLPPGDEQADVIVAGSGGGLDQEPHEVLGVSEDAPEPVVKGAFRELVKEAHGDQGGNGAYSVTDLKQARDELLT